MKSQLFKTVIVTLATFLLASNLFAQTTEIGNFTSLVLSDNLTINITQGDKNEYSTDPQNSGVAFENNNNKMSVSRGTSNGDVTINITCTNLNSIEVLGSGEVYFLNEFNASDFKLSLNGSGDIKAKLKSANISASVAGSGDIYLEGSTQNLNAKVTGSGDLWSSKMIAENVTVKVTGSGDAVVFVSKQLDANVTGSGDIRYLGNPATRNVDIVGSGSIQETSSDKAETKEIRIESTEKSTSNSSKDTTRLSIGDRKIIITEDDEDDTKKADKKAKKNADIKHIWAGVELGFNAYSNTQLNTTLPNAGNYALDYLRSNVVNINPFERNINLYNNKIALTTGLGFQFNRFMFDNNSTITPFKDSIQTGLASHSFKKNMLKTSFLTVPLLLQFNTSKDHDKSFHFAIGGQVGIKLGSRTKQVYYIDDNKMKEVFKNSFNLNPFQYGLTARVGYKKINVFANYNLSEMFKKGKGPELYPFQIGLTLIPF